MKCMIKYVSLALAVLCAAPALAQRTTVAEDVAGAEEALSGPWEAAPLASALIGELAALDLGVSQEDAERVLLDALLELGLVDGTLRMDIVVEALELVKAGDWPPAIMAALNSVSARASSEVALEDIIGVSDGTVFDGQLGPPPPAGPILVGSDYQ